MPVDPNPKQIIAQRLKDATNILVTVSRNPGVDELSAALALTMVLEKMDKSATAVFSGQIPPAIEFLEPGKTFDTNVDGLRDFIIALDKSKADRLRYKVEDDVVRVFITPYRTTISEKDLTFSEGDFNVDLIVAIGVENREDLDTAITAHGRILHDASVITINQLDGGSSLGEVDWSDVSSSSLCEMLINLTESLQSGLLDKPIATALLTGLVSVTDRFSNYKTSPKVMTMAAQLMAAGANQQLIAEKLEEASSVSTGKLNSKEDPTVVPTKPKNDNEIQVDHEDKDEDEEPLPIDEKQYRDALDAKAAEVAAANSARAVRAAKEELLATVSDKQLAPVATAEPPMSHAKVSSWRNAPVQAPSTGGSLSATSAQAQEDKLREEQDDKNHVILSHDNPNVSEAPFITPPVLNATTLADSEPTVKDIFSDATTPPAQLAVADDASDASNNAVQAFTSSSTAGLAFEDTQPPARTAYSVNQTLSELESEVHEQEQQEQQNAVVDPLDSARAAVSVAFGNQPFDPAGQPLVGNGAQSFGSIAHDAPATPAPATPIASAPEIPGLPPLPPLPDFSTLPPLPGEVSLATAPTSVPSFGLPEQHETHAPTTNATFPPTSSDPAQFKLPGQN